IKFNSPKNLLRADWVASSLQQMGVEVRARGAGQVQSGSAGGRSGPVQGRQVRSVQGGRSGPVQGRQRPLTVIPGGSPPPLTPPLPRICDDRPTAARRSCSISLNFFPTTRHVGSGPHPEPLPAPGRRQPGPGGSKERSRERDAAQEREARRRSREIDAMLARERRAVRRLVKILLLGAGESGKSTFLKQMRIINGQEFDQKALLDFRDTIYENVLKVRLRGDDGGSHPLIPLPPGRINAVDLIEHEDTKKSRGGAGSVVHGVDNISAGGQL
ncbi:hypothetical protein INR49_018278, partial [Caranx melampygus]